MKKIISAVLYIIAASASFSQSNNTEAIDTYCTSIDSQIIEDADIHAAYMLHTINFETNKRAIGKQYTTVKYYYPFPIDSVVETDDRTHFLYIYKPPVYVSVQYNIAAAQDNTFNYYFDNEGGLVFYRYLSEGAYGAEKEQFYFNKNKLIKFETHAADENIIKENDFTEHDLSRAANVLKKASEYQEMFDELVKLEDIDK